MLQKGNLWGNGLLTWHLQRSLVWDDLGVLAINLRAD